LRLGVNFIDILLAALLALLESVGIKAAHKLLVKLRPGVNFIDIFLAAFMHADPKSAKRD